jgi:transcription initiation factor TFIIIB Brf1 subunit/transcription initiation factor TFIIB
MKTVTKIPPIHCPSCHIPHNEYGENPDGSLTCTSCGFVFVPSPIPMARQKAEQDEQIVSRMVHNMTGLRSCIVTLKDGRDITLTYPKETEVKENSDFRGRLLCQMEELVMFAFPIAYKDSISTVMFDDEIGGQRGS